MKKSSNWLCVLIQVGLIAASLTMLIIFRQHIFRVLNPAVLRNEYNILLLFLAICFILLLTTEIVFTRINSHLQRHAREADLLKLKTKAQTDALTGLLNREAAIDQITHFLDTEGRNDCHTLLMIDLDNFKNINDSFGHFEGDKVLEILSSKIKSVFRTIDIVGRLGGDEFIVLMKHTATRAIVNRKAMELKSALEYVAGGVNVSVSLTGSIGISTYDGDGKTFETLYKEADEALYKAKLNGKNKYWRFYDTETQGNDDSGNTGKTALNESSAFIQLQALIDNIDGGIALLEVGVEIRALFLSHSFNKLMQSSVYSIANNKIFGYIFKEDIGQVEEVMRRGAASGEPVEAVFRGLTEDDKTKWYHIRAVRIQYEDSSKPVLIAIVTDVTNLKETELNYQAQKKQLETVLRISRVVTFEVDIARRTLYVTDSTMKKFGIDVFSIENMPEALIDAGAIHPDSVDECRRMYDEIYQGIPQGSAIIRTLKRDGQFTIERFTYFTVFDENGHPIKAVGVDEGMETRSETKLRVDLIEKQFRIYSDNMLTSIKVYVASDGFDFLKQESIPEEMLLNIKTYSDLLEYRLKRIVEPVDRQLIAERFGIDSLSKNTSDNIINNAVYKVFDEDGSVRWNSMGAGVYFDQFDGNAYAFVRTRDITFKKDFEISLKGNVDWDSSEYMFPFETLGKLADAYINRQSGEVKCAVVLLLITNYKYLLEQYGLILTKDMLAGFIGKTMTVISADYFACHVGKGQMALFIPEISSEALLEELTQKIIKFLRNPSFFQFHEEAFMEYGCGISCLINKMDTFEKLYNEALRALLSTHSLEEQTDDRITFYGEI